MAKQFVFKGNVHHNGDKFEKGNLCPDKHLKEMLEKGLVEALPEPVKATEPAKQDKKDEK